MCVCAENKAFVTRIRCLRVSSCIYSGIWVDGWIWKRLNLTLTYSLAYYICLLGARLGLGLEAGLGCGTVRCGTGRRVGWCSGQLKAWMEERCVGGVSGGKIDRKGNED